MLAPLSSIREVYRLLCLCVFTPIHLLYYCQLIGQRTSPGTDLQPTKGAATRRLGLIDITSSLVVQLLLPMDSHEVQYGQTAQNS